MKRTRYQTANDDYLREMVQNVVDNLRALINAVHMPASQIGDATGDGAQDTEAKSITAAADRNVSAVMHLSSEDDSDDESQDEKYFAANTSVVQRAQDVLGQHCVIISDTTVGKHAEMKILDYFFGQGRIDDMGYIGISKPCCLGCAAVIAVAQQQGVTVTVKGTHGGTYGTGWILPNYILVDEPSEDDHDGTTRFESFMGPTAMAKYWLISPDSRTNFLNRLNTRIGG